MIRTKSLLTVGLTSLALLASTAQAKVSPEEAAKLGKTLTPMGAEMAGNKEGTIPAWNPDFKIPEGYQGPGTRYVDPYADDKVLFTITAENANQYKDKLAPGMIELFKLYPETFKMNIYPSHRDGRFSEFAENNVIANATRAEVVDGGDGVINAFGGPPFPIPQSGVEAIWNMLLKSGSHYWQATATDVLVYRNGSQQSGRQTVTRLAPYYDPEMTLNAFQEQRLPRLYQTVQTLAPTREKGKAVLAYEYINPKDQPRAAWSYTPGVRRVRRAPTVSYDTPQGLGKLRTTDGSYGYNGSPDKYNWKLVGKKEMYVPYNNYKFENKDVDFKELLPQGHANPDYMRYELHRVWVVRAELKEGERHVYKTREFFLDEDSWMVMQVDQYDNRDVLWRTTLVNTINMYDMPGIERRSVLYYDLVSREYLAADLFNKEPVQPIVNQDPKQISYFTPSNLRKIGVR
ncbi:DUF1329 domain-containing protein [Endozoicomonas numazuensis]|uniref:Outer membrane lipoprotein-sorting protein n=1 Tax=Endozoicomonas numazuensis TaxID=1137799 RepID=A0A081NMT1_9GAMM|nr:DUF1329 domain-containing protein [Endozoicomonas numazuensis]KEQ19754.1 hypothetical protein GZ78_07765 [Endozoicomonas numazuensis]